ncbi:hypothetical protein [Sulfurimonas sp.]
MNIVLNTAGYKASRLVVADAILQPSFFKSRLKELTGRVSGETKDFYSTLFEEAEKKAQEKLAEKIEEGRFDGVANLKVSPFIQEIRGDVFVGAVAQGLGLIKEEISNGK